MWFANITLYPLGQSFWLFLSQLLSKATVKILDCSEGKVLPHFYTANRSVCASKYVLHFNGKYRVWRILSTYSSSRLEKSSRCAENHFKIQVLCWLPLLLLSLLSPLLRRIFQTEEMLGCPPPQLLNVTKASALQVLKETTKRRVFKKFSFRSRYFPRVKKNVGL